ncbi:MAG: hypothetical protein KQH67_00740 [Bacteroidetes bacterium]|nr:hypothetical protein [Bacteroidota bacterium]
MKKTIHILFTLVFTVITLGFTINKHYSGGELFSFSIFGEPESCCADVCNCCDEETQTIQFHADYVFSIDAFDHDQVELELFAAALPLSTIETTCVLSNTAVIDLDLPPPDTHSIFSFIQFYLL